MAMKKIRVGDTVTVLSGKDKNRTGKVLRFANNDRVVVEGLNLIKKHIRPNPQKNQQGGIVEREAAMHVSNIAVVNPTTNKAERIGFKILEDGKKVRYFKSNGEMVEV